MKSRILSLMCLVAPMFMYSQGIQWAKGLSWEQVKEKARQENKYIFLDCFATWCAPCKKMDRDIYPLKQIGDLYNQKFVSVRVQCDTTNSDDQMIRSWYKSAKEITTSYNVTSYPTFLFLDPDGELVQRASGALNEQAFIELANDAINKKGYPYLVKQFKRGDFQNLNLKDLSRRAKNTGDLNLAKAIASTYVERTDINELVKQENMIFLFYLGEDDPDWAKAVCLPKLKTVSIDDLANITAIRFLLYAARNIELVSKATDHWVRKMDERDLFNKDTLEYLSAFTQHTNDLAFKFLYKNAKRINKIKQKENWVEVELDRVILADEFNIPIYDPALKLVTDGTERSSIDEPDWAKLYSTIRHKYGNSFARRLRYQPKIAWYGLMKNASEYTKNIVAEMERSHGWNLAYLTMNDNAYYVFLYSRSQKEISIAAKWMKKYTEANPKDAAALDTYANLLYKLGKKEVGIQLQQHAVLLDNKNEELSDNLAKMKKGLATWPKGFDLVR